MRPGVGGECAYVRIYVCTYVHCMCVYAHVLVVGRCERSTHESLHIQTCLLHLHICRAPGGATLLKVEDERLKDDDLYEVVYMRHLYLKVSHGNYINDSHYVYIVFTNMYVLCLFRLPI